MKVLFATYPTAFHTPGGGEMQLRAYRRHLPSRGVSVTLLDPWKPRFLDHDLVHFFSCTAGSSHFCAFVKQLGLPLVVSSSLWITAKTRDHYPVDEIRHQLHLADRIVTNSDLEGDTLSDVLGLPRHKFVTVYNGVEEGALTPTKSGSFRRRYSVPEPYVLNVGNIEQRKNQARLVRAMRSFPDARLVLVGHVRDRTYLEEVLAEGGEQVRFVGPLPHGSAILRSAYRDCAAFALPSKLETPGLSALEAAAQNANLILTREGSAQEYFGDSAIYVDPESTDAIAAGIARAFESSRRPGPSKPQRELVRSRFLWRDNIGSLKSIYEEALNGGLIA